jgi:carbon starvation protein CstA
VADVDQQNVSDPARHRHEPPGSFAAYVLMVLSAEILFALLVTLALGTPPGGVTTVAFGFVVAVGLGIQRRTVGDRMAPSQHRQEPRSTRH